LPAAGVTRERAALIARSHACGHCREYSFRKVVVDPAPQSQRQELKTRWVVRRICGICGHETELGIDQRGEIVYGG
jgi:hypothetical protein